MRPKGLLIAVVVLAVLGGLIWWSNKKQAASPAKSATDTTIKLLTIPDDQFQEIRIKKLNGEVEDLKRENGRRWGRSRRTRSSNRMPRTLPPMA
jgi:hypothetical protein